MMDIIQGTVMILLVVTAGRISSINEEVDGSADQASMLEPRQIQRKCCGSRWGLCCRDFPWENIAIDNHGHYCDKYPLSLFNSTYAMNCVNYQLVVLRVKKQRNIIYKNHRCYYKKDPVFVDKLLVLESRMNREAARCCQMFYHEDDAPVGDVVQKIFETDIKMQAVDRIYVSYRAEQNPSCASQGRAMKIGDKLARAVWEMGILIKCAGQLYCVGDL